MLLLMKTKTTSDRVEITRC